MDIQSAFNSGVQGFNRAQETVEESALAISRATLSEPEIQSAVSSVVPPATAGNTANSQQPNPQLSNSQLSNSELNPEAEDITDLNQELVDLRVAEFQASASVNVIRTADEVLGTLIDVTA